MKANIMALAGVALLALCLPGTAAAQTGDGSGSPQTQAGGTAGPETGSLDQGASYFDQRGEIVQLPGYSGRVTDDPFLSLPSSPATSDPLLSRERYVRRGGGDRSSGVTVLERRRPEYDPVGIQAGGFTILPLVTTSANYNSNVFKQPDGNGDLYGIVHAEALARSDWTRHRLVAEGYVEQRTFLDYSSEDTFNYRGALSGQLDISRLATIDTALSHERSFLDRGAVGEILDTREPVRFDRTATQIGGTLGFGRFVARVTGAAERTDFDDSEALDGSIVDQQFRDSTRYGVSGQLNYTITPARSVFVSIARDWWKFRLPSNPDRDLSSYEILAGIESEITPLLRGRFSVGYLTADFVDPTVENRSSWALDVRVDYLLSELTTLKFSGRRTLRNVATAASPAALVTSLSAGADHELLRNLIVSGAVVYEDANYIESPLSARLIAGSVSARYFLNNRFRFNAGLSVGDRDVDGFANDRSYNAINLTGGVTVQF